MELDFTKLNNIDTEATESPTMHDKGSGATLTPNNSENATEGKIEQNTGILRLQREADERESEKYRAIQVYKEYQNNIRTSSQLNTEIIKGLQAGEDIYRLFLKAIKSISLMTSDNVIYTIAERDIREIYGIGLQEPQPLKIELEQVAERLAKLEKAEAEHNGLNISRAIKMHRTKVAELTELLEKA